MRLSKWIAVNGGRDALARTLKITPQTVHYWVTGKGCPTALMMVNIIQATNGAVSAKDILDECLFKKREEQKAARV